MATKTVKIVKGSDATVTVQLVKEDDLTPFSLAGFTGATAYFPKDPSGSVAVTGSLVSEDLGEMSFTLSETSTDTLLTGTELDVEVEVDQGTTKTIKQILGTLEVADRLFQE